MATDEIQNHRADDDRERYSGQQVLDAWDYDWVVTAALLVRRRVQPLSETLAAQRPLTHQVDQRAERQGHTKSPHDDHAPGPHCGQRQALYPEAGQCR